MTRLLFIFVLTTLVVILSMSQIVQAQAQQNQTQKSIAGLTGNAAREAMDKEYKTGLSLQLHNASRLKQDQSSARFNLFNCIDYLINPSKTDTFLNASLSLCDSKVTNMIVKHELGSNQSMINAAYAYLKERGIQ